MPYVKAKRRCNRTAAPFCFCTSATVARGGPGALRLFLLSRHKTENRWYRLPHRNEAAAPRGWRPARPVADRGRGVACPTCGAGVVRSFPWRKSWRTRRPAPRAMPGAAAVFLRRGENYLSYTTRKKGLSSGVITKLFSNIFSWPLFRPGRTHGQCSCERPRPLRFPRSSCQGSGVRPPGGPVPRARS